MREQVVVAVLCCACLSFRSGRYIPNFGLERRFMAAVSLPPLRAPSYHAAAFLYCSSINKMKVRRLLFSVLQRFATSTSTVSNQVQKKKSYSAPDGGRFLNKKTLSLHLTLKEKKQQTTLRIMLEHCDRRGVSTPSSFYASNPKVSISFP